MVNLLTISKNSGFQLVKSVSVTEVHSLLHLSESDLFVKLRCLCFVLRTRLLLVLTALYVSRRHRGGRLSNTGLPMLIIVILGLARHFISLRQRSVNINIHSLLVHNFHVNSLKLYLFFFPYTSTWLTHPVGLSSSPEPHIMLRFLTPSNNLSFVRS